MRALSELFEFLSNCDYQTMMDEIREHGTRITGANSRFQSETVIGFDLERLNTLARFSEYYFSAELPRILREQEKQSNPEELLTVKEVARFLKVSTVTVYGLLKKGILKKFEISTVSKPGNISKVRIRKLELEKFLEGSIWQYLLIHNNILMAQRLD
jgi:excisionase family DNA binding protein